MSEMRTWKKGIAAGLALVLALSLAACGGETAETPTPTPTPDELMGIEEPVTMRVAALKGPTAMGLVKLMNDAESGNSTDGSYEFTLAASADEVTPLLVKGDLDAACVPANLAAVLYNKTEGQIVTLGVNTLGVLYIVEKGESVQSMADLKGQTIIAAGKGSTPEYALRYLLQQNGIDPDKDVTIDWKSEHAECVAALASGNASIALLPQPFVTVVVARKEFVETYPYATAHFLMGYAGSVGWVNENTADAAALIAEYGIVEAAPVAEKALPHCNIVCITGQEMYEKLSGYLSVLYEQAPESVGGELPRDDFYYGA